MLLDSHIVLSSLVLLCISAVPVSAAQDPIRVQSHEVLVPTVVFDKVIYAQLNKMKPHHRDSYGHLVTKNEKLWDSIAVKGLTEKDFHLFEDGVEQKIQRAQLEPPAFRVVEDNLGKHPEIVGSGGGLWAYAGDRHAGVAGVTGVAAVRAGVRTSEITRGELPRNPGESGTSESGSVDAERILQHGPSGERSTDRHRILENNWKQRQIPER